MRFLFLLLLVFLLTGNGVLAQDSVRRDSMTKPVVIQSQNAGTKWGVLLPPTEFLKSGAQQAYLKKLGQYPQWISQTPLWVVEAKKSFSDRTAEFYLLVLLLGILGLIRANWPRYFHNLWRAFWQGGTSSPALRTQLEDATQPAVLMNLLFALTGGAYIYYLSRLYGRTAVEGSPAGTLVILIGGVALVYIFKWAAIQASGWAFGVKNLTGSYLFNVFLINKVMTMALLPLTILLAFAAPQWAIPVAAVSFALVAALVLLRYIRAWPTLRAFFNNSHFHFLTYFCASEILPLAVLTKLLLPFLGR